MAKKKKAPPKRDARAEVTANMARFKATKDRLVAIKAELETIAKEYVSFELIHANTLRAALDIVGSTYCLSFEIQRVEKSLEMAAEQATWNVECRYSKKDKKGNWVHFGITKPKKKPAPVGQGGAVAEGR